MLQELRITRVLQKIKIKNLNKKLKNRKKKKRTASFQQNTASVWPRQLQVYFVRTYSKYPHLDGLDLIPETKQRAKMLTISDPAP